MPAILALGFLCVSLAKQAKSPYYKMSRSSFAVNEDVRRMICRMQKLHPAFAPQINKFSPVTAYAPALNHRTTP